LLRTVRREGDPRLGPRRPRPLRHEAGRHARTGLADGRPHRLVASDPVSWLMIERGWRVVDEKGIELGRVDEVEGDPERDIFSGLTVGAGILSRGNFIPAEDVTEITEGRIRVRGSHR